MKETAPLSEAETEEVANEANVEVAEEPLSSIAPAVLDPDVAPDNLVLIENS